MKKIGFIGAFDKTDLILYISKILVELKQKVLMIDTTITQKARYTVPSIAPSKCYVTEHEGIDVAVGFKSLDEIESYLGTSEFKYDFILIDVDSNKEMHKMELNTGSKNYFITGFDSYSLKRGLEIIGQSQDKVIMTKVLFSRYMLDEEDDYLNFLSFYYAVQWEKKKVYFPLEIGDSTIMIENQRSARIKFKELSAEYREGLYSLVCNIAPELNKGEIRKILKNM